MPSKKAMTAAILIALLLTLGLSKAPHVYWICIQSGPASAVPTAPLPASPEPENTKLFQVGPLSVRLAPGWAQARGSAGPLLFRNGGRAIIISCEETASDPSLVRLQEAAYRAGRDDFRWSMSWQELADFRSLLVYKKLVCSSWVSKVETLYREDLEGLLLAGDKRASFDWVSTDGKASGTLLFSEEGPTIDLSWVRPVCTGLKYEPGAGKE
jgi:hypothetical protein